MPNTKAEEAGVVDRLDKLPLSVDLPWTCSARGLSDLYDDIGRLGPSVMTGPGTIPRNRLCELRR